MSAMKPKPQRPNLWTMMPLTLVLIAGFSLQAADATDPASAVEFPAGSKPWASFLPFMSEMATERGYELQLPIGVSGIYNYIQRDIDINGLRIGPAGSPTRNVSRLVNLGSNSEVNVGLTRLDAWMLPFLNVYGLAGYVDNHTVTQGTVSRPGPRGQTIDILGTTDLNGFVGGFGLTLAGGYKDFFIMGDVNWSQTDLGFDDEFRATVASARAGWNGKISAVPARFWVGAMYWDTANIAKATGELPGHGLIRFEADQGPANPWNASVGASVGLSRHWEWFGEYGFNLDDVRLVVTGIVFRF